MVHRELTSFHPSGCSALVQVQLVSIARATVAEISLRKFLRYYIYYIQTVTL